MLKITYAQASGFLFQQAIQKMGAAPTNGQAAYRINKILAPIKAARERIAVEYKKDIVAEYAKKDADGKFDEANFQPDESKLEEFQKAQDAFGLREIDVPRPKLSLSDVKDVKLSADELAALEPILDDAEGDLPQMPRQGMRLA